MSMVSGNKGRIEPPENSPCRHCWFGDLRANAAGYCGGGTGDTKTVVVKGLEDFNLTLRALGALIEDVAVSLGVKIKASGFFPEDRMMNRFTSERPVEAMKEKPGMRD